MRVANIHSKVDARTMKVELRGLDGSGEVTDESFGTLEFKRQRRQPRKKEADRPRKSSKAGRQAKADGGAQ
jgi:hypothetical protein